MWSGLEAYKNRQRSLRTGEIPLSTGEWKHQGDDRLDSESDRLEKH